MPDAAVEPQQAQGANAQAPQGGFGRNFIGTIFRMVFFWWLMNYFKKGGKDSSQPAYMNLFQRGEPVDIKFFIDVSSVLTPVLIEREPDWELNGIRLVTEEENRAKNLTIELPFSVLNNGTIYLHTIVTREGYDFERRNAFFGSTQLNYYGPKKKESKEKNLLFDEKTEQDEKEEEVEESVEIVNYWKPRMTIALVDDFSKHTHQSVPPHLKRYFRVTEDGGYYYPMIYFNEFWLLKSNLVEVNETVQSVSIELTLSTIKPWLVQIYSQMDEAFRSQAAMGLNSDAETDEFKRILVEGNPILLGITFVVSMLHSVFDFLAFKNDIGFWKNNQSMEGLSARSIIINAACQVIVFLYLLDNDTSFVVLLSTGVGVLIEFWKVTKAMNVTFRRTVHGIPYLHFSNRASYERSRTREHDEQAMKYLAYALYPLVIGYSIYALMYQSHKSWYSWILNSLVGAVYTFGFILMCPQLYLNYKLKSVAHLPWRQLTYKFLNTIIDDLFAFVIKMPWLHRLSVFRDDVIFLIYLYQWRIYGVDKSRVNEFGFSEETQQTIDEAKEEEEEEETTASAEEEENKEEEESNQESTTGLRQRRVDNAADREEEEEADVDEPDTNIDTKKDN
eukprot:g867.t1